MNSRTEQLDGWKEIACHLKRSVRSVQRWERNEKLPVRRHEHAHGVSVYAFSHELEAWWRNERRSSKKPSSKENEWDHLGKQNNKRFSGQWPGEDSGRVYVMPIRT